MIGFVYKLTDNSDKAYYGSTINPLKIRLCQHKTPRNHCISKNMHKDSMKIECLEQYYFDTDMDYKTFLIKRESYYIRNNECINKRIEDRTKKEYNKMWNDKNKEYMKQYNIDNRELKREYYDQNKEKITLNKKEYYEKNKDKINEKFTCECGGKYTIKHKLTHSKTKKHIAYNLSTKSS
tara:strand:- start:685 stop:1224 length:540 start_codon:yes stop_codon:yes gene_type:complete